MIASTRPRVVVSKCIEFDRCRYNGLMISSEVVTSLKPHIEPIPICPEVEIGLGIPRDPVRIVSAEGTLKLLQPETGGDFTKNMMGFASGFLKSLRDVDGFILKSRSPSCGLKEVKIYPTVDPGPAIAKGNGFFGQAVLDAFPMVAIEDEGRLRNFRIREHFLSRLFTHARFRTVSQSPAMKELVRFHSEHKLLLMAYSQKELRELGRVVANHDKRSVREVFEKYGEGLYRALSRVPRYTSNVNVLMHALGYFSKELSHEEKAFLLDSLEQYRGGKIPLSVPVSLVRSWIIRFEESYLSNQVFFRPYPLELMEITDSGKGRDF
jgi:uncharacterized protein YbgA (DUF1722 family)/uncharacterized protein YbbK (DUF523 family)